MCSCLIAARYTLMVVCDMLLAARYVANSIRVFSVVGTGRCPMDLQKWWNFCCPAV